ncbi:MAG: HEAT repeat domain-containing protein, partial [Phycisphaerae bacterium]|nr:HEAT repeat domain-containing protein [Phycisphaerae bacterium]
VPMAALAGLARVGGAEEAMPELLKAITNPAAEKDVKAARMQLAAASYAVYLPGEKVTKELVDAVAKAEPPVQAVLIDTLGKRGDAAARATVIKALKSSDPDVQVAAIGALKTLGNGESVKVLADIAATTTGAQRDAARESLKWMKGTDVDEAITAQVASAKDRVKAELIRAAAVRLMKPLMNEMLAFVNDSDDSVRTPVIYNVGKLAELKDLPKVLKAFTTANDSSADAINEAIVRIGGRVGPAAEQKDPSQKIQMVKQAEADANKRATALVAAMKEAGPASQALVVRALLNSRCAVALEAVREAAKSQDERVKQAAAKALAAWGPVYCYDFVFSGPYRKDGAKVTDLFDVAFPPEDASAQVEWKQIGPETDSARFDLQQVDRGNDCCAYMKTTIVSDSDQDVILTFGSDDGVKVWLNGQVVHSNNTTRAFTADQDQVKASLKKGDNVLMVKVTQGGSDWKLMFGTKSVDGGPAGGIRYQAK